MVVNSIMEAEPPSVRDFIMGPLLGSALAGFDISVNRDANIDIFNEAYVEEVLLPKPVVVAIKNGPRVRADRTKFYVSYSEKYGRFRLRVLLGRLNPTMKVFRRYKFEYITHFTNHEAERQQALDLIVKQYGVAHTLLRTTEFSRAGQLSAALLRQGFKKYTMK